MSRNLPFTIATLYLLFKRLSFFWYNGIYMFYMQTFFLLPLQRQLINRLAFLMYLIQCFVTVFSFVVTFAFHHLLNKQFGQIVKCPNYINPARNNAIIFKKQGFQFLKYFTQKLFIDTYILYELALIQTYQTCLAYLKCISNA